MRIHSVRLTNFRQHADTYLELDTGLTGIIGANGTGKTTLLEAIAWALYGTVAARGNRDSIRSLRAPPRATVKVELDFELGGHRYRVVRGLTSAELYLDRASAPIANSISGVTEVLRRRLGMSHDEFFNTYFTGQKELSVMAAMGPADRAEFLSRLLGYERLTVARELARERRKAVVAEATGVKSGMPDADTVKRAVEMTRELLALATSKATSARSESEQSTAAVASITPKWESVQEERARVHKLDADFRVAEGEETARTRELERQDKELAELATAQSELTTLRSAIAPLAASRVELETMDRLAREEGRRQTHAARERELGVELAKLAERRAQIETAPRLDEESALELKQRRDELVSVEEAYQNAHMEWVRDRQEADTRIEQRTQALVEYRKQRELLLNEGENGTCPICSRPLGDHYRSVLSHIDDQIDDHIAELKYLRDRVAQLATAPPDVAALDVQRREMIEGLAKLEKKRARIQLAVQELSKLDADVADREAKRAIVLGELAGVPIGYSPERHFELRKRVGDLQLLESRATKLAGALERDAQLRSDRERVHAALGIIRVRLAELAAERATVQGFDERFEIVRKAFDTAVAAQRTADVELATARARQASAVSAAEVAERAVVDLQKAVARLAELDAERRLHEELERAYTDLRTELNLQLRPDISARASVLLAELTDDRYSELELDESFDVILLENGLPRPVISGGEEDLTNLVLRLSISQMIAERAGQPLSLLILDEVFGSLDESRRNNVVDLLRRLHDRFEQVIVITHVESVRLGVDHTVTVTYDEESGTSRIEQEATQPLVDTDQLEMGAA